MRRFAKESSKDIYGKDSDVRMDNSSTGGSQELHRSALAHSIQAQWEGKVQQSSLLGLDSQQTWELFCGKKCGSCGKVHDKGRQLCDPRDRASYLARSKGNKKRVQLYPPGQTDEGWEESGRLGRLTSWYGIERSEEATRLPEVLSSEEEEDSCDSSLACMESIGPPIIRSGFSDYGEMVEQQYQDSPPLQTETTMDLGDYQYGENIPYYVSTEVFKSLYMPD